MLIKPPYLLYLGNAQDLLSIKIAKGIKDWRPELCAGELALSDCKVSTGIGRITLAQAKQRGVKTMVVGLANSGGKIDSAWLPDLIQALEMGFDLASGLHQKLTDFSELTQAAQRNTCRLIDVRHADYPLITGSGRKRSGKRLLTVGTDCSIGKMYTALRIEKALKEKQRACHFIATGQSGIFISGKGIAIDCVLSDFISGVVESLSPDNDPDHWDIIEGQGSLFHPAFAGVSLGLLHGAQADALVLCHQLGRKSMRGLDHFALPDLDKTLRANLGAAHLTNPKARFVGLALNTSDMDKTQAKQACEVLEKKYQLVCVDPMRDGVDRIIQQL
ncbi:MAG: N-acetyltransferase DgcN [Enterobacterales bacterium]|nr:N-acetyltransferase DgcN [Enterobacterales bacterium]